MKRKEHGSGWEVADKWSGVGCGEEMARECMEIKERRKGGRGSKRGGRNAFMKGKWN